MRTPQALLFLGLLGLASWQAEAPPPRELELVYLANEGFLLRSGDRSVLVDAFVTQPYGPYAAVPAELFERVLAGEPPFDGVDLALVSHAHRDHFQPEPASRYLRARAEVPLLSSPQVLDELLQTLGEDPAAARLEAQLPKSRESLRLERAGIRLEFLRLPHAGGARNSDVENLGHVVELGDLRVLHVGDAAAETEDFAAYGLAERELDVALVPYWWLADAHTVARARELTGAEHLVAIHVPTNEVADVKRQLAALDPDIVLFEKPGDARKLACKPK